MITGTSSIQPTTSYHNASEPLPDNVFLERNVKNIKWSEFPKDDTTEKIKAIIDNLPNPQGLHRVFVTLLGFSGQGYEGDAFKVKFNQLLSDMCGKNQDAQIIIVGGVTEVGVGQLFAEASREIYNNILFLGIISQDVIGTHLNIAEPFLKKGADPENSPDGITKDMFRDNVALIPSSEEHPWSTLNEEGHSYTIYPGSINPEASVIWAFGGGDIASKEAFQGVGYGIPTHVMVFEPEVKGKSTAVNNSIGDFYALSKK